MAASITYWHTPRLAVVVLFAIPLLVSAQLNYPDVAHSSDNQALEQQGVTTEDDGSDDDAGFAAPADKDVAEAEQVAAQAEDAVSPPPKASLVAVHQKRNASAEASVAPSVNATPTVAPMSPEEKAKDDVKKGHLAAAVAAKAASTAQSVAERSVKMTHEAQETLRHAQDAIHHARVDTVGLSDEQRNALKDAEHHLMDGISNVHPDAVYIAQASAQLGTPNYIEAARGKKVTVTHVARKREEKEEERRKKLEVKLSKLQGTDEHHGPHHSFAGKTRKLSEVDQMKADLEALKKRLKASKNKVHAEDAEAIEVQLQELEDMVGQMKKSDDGNDQLKSEIVRLEKAVTDLEDSTQFQTGDLTYKMPMKKAEEEEKAADPEKGKLTYRIPPSEEPEPEEQKPIEGLRTLEHGSLLQQHREVPSVNSKGIDIDTEMPYGELEPFGREDTAQELTEASIHESDAMVDQLERAEVSEEKRAVFRALTRLRGAAITSFDGVARSQTGNIDEYNKVHQWRTAHPLHHLADEESDISKWAFPDNADF